MAEEDYKNSLYEDLKYSTSKFDAQVLTISTSSIGVSLAFIKNIVPFKDAIYSWVFYSALIVFVICLILSLIGHYLAVYQM